MDAKKQKCEAPTETLYDALKREPRYLTGAEVEILNEQLGLDKITEGFLSSRHQINILASIIKRHESEFAMRLCFYPLSCTVVCGWRRHATQVMAFTKTWRYGTCDIYMPYFQDWSFVKSLDFDYVAFGYLPSTFSDTIWMQTSTSGYNIQTPTDNLERAKFFVGWDKEKQKRVNIYTSFVERNLGPPAAFIPGPYDIVLYDPRATLCLIRDAGGDDNLLAPDNLPRDLFGLLMKCV